MEKKPRKGPPDMMQKVYLGGIHYAPFEMMFDRRLEGAENWRNRVLATLHRPPTITV
jgi:hypothetical protein